MIARLGLLRTAALAGLALASLLLLFVASSRGADVTTFTVTSLDDEAGVETCEPNSDCTLREAIQSISEEEEENGRYKIVFTVQGTIELAEQLILYSEEEGVEVEIEGPGSALLTVDGSGNGRVLTARDVNLTMSGVTLTGGEESGVIHGGGGLLVDSAGATLTDVDITDNEIGGDGAGGGIAVEGEGALQLYESLVADNVSESEMGGGIFIDSISTANIEGSTIEGNWAKEDAGGGIAAENPGISVIGSTIAGNRSLEGGGGIWYGESESGTEIAGSRILNNTSGTDGGGVKSRSELFVRGTTFSGNTAGGSGGGLYAEEDTEVVRSTFAANKAEGGGLGGGGIATEGPLELLTSTVAGNEGGGVAAEDETLAVRNSTVVGNDTPQGGNAAGVDGGEARVTSSILYGNLRDGLASDCGGSVESKGFNLLGTEAGCGWTGASGDRIGEDPELAPLGDYGGPTATMPPEARLSPAINHGQNPGSTDQRGFTRPVPAGDSNTDIGAVEVQAPSAEVVPSVSPSAGLDAGDTLTCDPGEWSADTISDPATSYAWIRDPGGADEDLGSAPTLELTAAMAGEDIVCRVTVDNGAVAVAASSNAVELEPGVLAVSPGEVEFGEQRVGGGPSASETVVVEATGGVPFELTEIVSTNAGVYPIDASDCSGQTLLRSSCEIEVSFDPDAPGFVAAAIEVRSGNVERSVDLGGTGIEPEFGAAPPALSLATTEVGAESPTQAVVVSNQGNGELAFGEVLVEGADPGDFRIAAENCGGASLGSLQTCEVEVAFAPTAPGARAAQLVLTGADPGSVPLSGTAIAPGLAATPAALDFGSQTLGAGPGAPQTVVLSNPGTAPLRIDSIAIAGPGAATFSFAANGCIGGQLAPGAECSLSLVFDPAAAGSSNASLVVAGGVTATVPLSGLGVEAQAPAAPRLQLQRGKGPLAVGSDGVVRPRFACASAGASCQASVSLLRAPGAGAGVPAKLGSKRVTLGAGQSRALAIPLNKAARRALAERGRLPVVLALEAPATPARINLSLRASG